MALNDPWIPLILPQNSLNQEILKEGRKPAASITFCVGCNGDWYLSQGRFVGADAMHLWVRFEDISMNVNLRCTYLINIYGGMWICKICMYEWKMHTFTSKNSKNGATLPLPSICLLRDFKTYAPNAGVMVIYHGRKKQITKTTNTTQIIYCTWHLHEISIQKVCCIFFLGGMVGLTLTKSTNRPP